MANRVVLHPQLEHGRDAAQLKTRVRPDIKRRAYSLAVERDVPLREIVEAALERYVSEERVRVYA